MIHLSEISQIREKIKIWKQSGCSIAFVPTMGNLHAGHLALIERAKESADKVVVSIFVNPIQFDKEKDLQAYPRTLEDDKQKLLSVECDLVFTPSVKALYPRGENITRVEVSEISELLEGRSRPGHFSGVSTIVTKFFNIVLPDISIFGEKDFQQLMLVRKMVSDLNMNIEVIGLPTLRESDGLAMSSRNGYLTDKERQIAPQFYKEMQLLVKNLRKGVKDFQSLQLSLMNSLKQLGFKPDYIEICKVHDLTVASAKDVEMGVVVLGSVWLGKARLIDNIVVTV